MGLETLIFVVAVGVSSTAYAPEELPRIEILAHAIAQAECNEKAPGKTAVQLGNGDLHVYSIKTIIVGIPVFGCFVQKTAAPDITPKSILPPGKRAI